MRVRRGDGGVSEGVGELVEGGIGRLYPRKL